MDAVQARTVLDDVEQVRRRARGDRQATSLPLLTFGVLAAGDAAVRLVLEPVGGSPFWLLGAPAGFALLARSYRRREADLGVGTRSEAYRSWAIGLLVAALVLPVLLLFGAILALVGLGLGVIAWRQRNAALGAWAVFVALWAVGDGTYFLHNRLFEALRAIGGFGARNGYVEWAGVLVAATLAVALLTGGLVHRAREGR